VLLRATVEALVPFPLGFVVAWLVRGWALATIGVTVIVAAVLSIGPLADAMDDPDEDDDPVVLLPLVIAWASVWWIVGLLAGAAARRWHAEARAEP
jgi:hypothetical protein